MIFDTRGVSPTYSFTTNTPPDTSNRLPVHTSRYLNACPGIFPLVASNTHTLPSKKLATPPEMVPVILAARYQQLNSSVNRIKTAKSIMVAANDAACAFTKVTIGQKTFNHIIVCNSKLVYTPANISSIITPHPPGSNSVFLINRGLVISNSRKNTNPVII